MFIIYLNHTQGRSLLFQKKIIADYSRFTERQKKTTSMFQVNSLRYSIAYLSMVNTSVSAESGAVSGFSSLDQDFR